MVGESKKYCLLTDEAHDRLRIAIQETLDEPSGNFSGLVSEIARLVSLDDGPVGKILDRKTVSYSTLKKMMEGFDLELTENSYIKQAPPKSPGVAQARSKAFLPNPFEEAVFWGREELLRQIFEQLGKGGSQALIGPAGCGKSKILEAIVREGADRLGRDSNSFLYIDMHEIRDEMGFFNELCHLLDFDSCDQNQLRRKLKKSQKSYVLCLDEIHVLTDEAFFPVATRNWLKAMADAEYPLQLVVASQKELDMLFPESPLRSSPLADFFRSQTVQLGYWSLAQVTGFVGDRLQGTGVEFDMARIWEESGGQPRWVRELAGQLYEAIVARPEI